MKWQITIMTLHDNGHRYKVTRTFSLMGVNETKFFASKKKAEMQLKKWLQEGPH
jgi:hypothetical protein